MSFVIMSENAINNSIGKLIYYNRICNCNLTYLSYNKVFLYSVWRINREMLIARNSPTIINSSKEDIMLHIRLYTWWCKYQIYRYDNTSGRLSVTLINPMRTSTTLLELFLNVHLLGINKLTNNISIKSTIYASNYNWILIFWKKNSDKLVIIRIRFI